MEDEDEKIEKGIGFDVDIGDVVWEHVDGVCSGGDSADARIARIAGTGRGRC